MKEKAKIKKNILPYVLFAIIIILFLMFSDALNRKVNILTYGEFNDIINQGEVEEITVIFKDRTKIYEITGRLKSYEEKEMFYTKAPLSETVINNIIQKQTETNFILDIKADPESSAWIMILVNVLPLATILIIGFVVFSKQAGGANKSFDFGKSRAKLHEESKKITFDEVAGLDEEKEEVAELIDFLKNPKKFQKLGARIPKGVLLVGPPGTGKTLLARSVAGESNVPFYFISGSDFVELFVGVGASRVRDMFRQAKQTAPCLVFIDEIDAVGRQRGAGLGGGHDEREQTLNQLLTEMDGFGSNEGIIIIAATNRPDVLDPALLRPGRFDRQITVSLPDAKAREQILQVHAKNKIFADTVNLKNVAKRTVGFSGADLENLLNEAALLAVRREKENITMSEIDEATDRVIMGPAKVSKKYSDKEKEMVAYHEAGHVVLGLKLSDAHIVQKVTIIPRGYAGGYAMMTPKEEKYLETKEELIERITGLLGGRAAEELIYKQITTGARSDFDKATKIARSMVTEYGMSALGLVKYEHEDEGVFLGRDYTKSRAFSNEIAHEIDLEIKTILEECYKQATTILKKHIKLLKLIAESLVEHETLTKEQIEFLDKEGRMPTEEEVSKEE